MVTDSSSDLGLTDPQPEGTDLPLSDPLTPLQVRCHVGRIGYSRTGAADDFRTVSCR
jgi:hypothetical protein